MATFTIRVRRSDRDYIDPVRISGAKTRAEAEAFVREMFAERLVEIVPPKQTGRPPASEMSPTQRLRAIRIYCEGLAEDFPELKTATDNILKLTGETENAQVNG